MNKLLKIFSGLIILISLLLGFAYYSLEHIDFIGKKDPKAVEANLKRWDGILLSAEYRNGTDYCEVNLLDSSNIEINIGDSYGGSILNKEYTIKNDTIVIAGGLTEINKYNFSSKLLIQNGKLFYRLRDINYYDTTVAMKIKTRKTKL